ncbi:MAG: hypothetical protein U0166_22545 [Acidobacteriota bacterium]
MKRARRHPLPAIYALVAATAPGVVTADPATQLPGQIQRGLALIHEGKLPEGEEALRAYAATHPRSRPALVYAGVACWWQHISELGSERAAADAIDYFNRALATGEVTDGSDVEALFEAGLSHMLLSHLYGAQGSVLKAAFEAKKGKALLETAREKDPGNKDVGFALGAYDYYADRLPKVMKGVRAILRLPGGNASRGIQELETTSREGKVFACEAALVLADIYASNWEHKYVQGIDLVSALVVRYPDNPFFLAGRADLWSEVGEHGKALEDIARARSLVAGEDTTLSVSLQSLEARIRDKGYETAAGVRLLEPVVTNRAALLPKAQVQRLRFQLGEMYERLGELDKAKGVFEALTKEELDDRTEKRVDKKLGKSLESAGDSYRENQDAITLLRSGSAAEAGETLGKRLEQHPDDPVLLFLRAEAMTALGLHEKAKALYEQAYTRAGEKFPWIGGWCLVRRGDRELAAGDREQALQTYSKALAIGRWSSDGVVNYRLGLAASIPHPAEAGDAGPRPAPPPRAPEEAKKDVSSGRRGAG